MRTFGNIFKAFEHAAPAHRLNCKIFNNCKHRTEQNRMILNHIAERCKKTFNFCQMNTFIQNIIVQLPLIPASGEAEQLVNAYIPAPTATAAATAMEQRTAAFTVCIVIVIHSSAFRTKHFITFNNCIILIYRALSMLYIFIK